MRISSFLFYFYFIFSTCHISLGAEKKDPSFATYFERPPLQALDRQQLYTLRVGFVEHPAMVILTDQQVAELFRVMESTTLERLGYRIKLKLAWRRPIQDFYESHKDLANIPAMAQLLSYDIDMWSKRSNEQLLKISRGLFEQHGPQKIFEYINYTVDKIKVNEHSMSQQFYSVHRSILKARSKSGQSVYDPARPDYHSYWWLDVILHNLQDADFIFVNHLVCTPDSGMPLYTMARGGVNTGAVENNIHNNFGGAGFVSLYPFFPIDPYFKKVTGPIPAQDTIKVAATYSTHELGHLLDRRIEIYDHQHCISKAAISLNYLAWYKDVMAGTCNRLHPASKTF